MTEATDQDIMAARPGDDALSHYWAVLDEKRNVQYFMAWATPINDPLFFQVTNGQYRQMSYLRDTLNKGVHIAKDGQVTSFDPPPPPPPPLKEQAQSALSEVQSQAPMLVAMGECFGPRTQAYVKALQAIITGADTTSTTLPAQAATLTD